jgi:lipoprotein-anchoring transpeptidase ErfK/SrfK
VRPVQAVRPQQAPPRILSASQRMRAIQAPPRTPAYAPVPPSRSQFPAPPAHQQSARRPAQRGSGLSRKHVLIAGAVMFAGIAGFGLLIVGFLATMVLGGNVLPGVSAGGIELGGLSEDEAAARLQTAWSTITIRDGSRSWNVSPASLGITLDAAATAARAAEQGRGAGNLPAALLGDVEVAPVVIIDTTVLQSGLEALADTVWVAPVNAGIRLVDGRVEATPPIDGRALNVAATVDRITRLGADALTGGALSLATINVTPDVTDSSGLVSAASQMLTSPLTIRVYDPVTGDSVEWAAQPVEWARWITAASNPTGSALAISLDGNAVRDFLTGRATVFDASRYLNYDEAVQSIQTAVAGGATRANVRVYHRARQHVVQSGESIVSIAWDYGLPYPYLQEANPGVSSLSAGQTITIPAADTFLADFPVVADKRIVVSISQQRVWVYEGGALKWDWPASTGIADSPTWPGIYQIISHEPNAYAGNWDLWMPNFMGVYRPIPGSGFTNGFHGFPTRGGGQILWENSLGRRVTYGCILISDANVNLLYNWAEEGVVVEIQP